MSQALQLAPLLFHPLPSRAPVLGHKRSSRADCTGNFISTPPSGSDIDRCNLASSGFGTLFSGSLGAKRAGIQLEVELGTARALG